MLLPELLGAAGRHGGCCKGRERRLDFWLQMGDARRSNHGVSGGAEEGTAVPGGAGAMEVGVAPLVTSPVGRGGCLGSPFACLAPLAQ